MLGCDGVFVVDFGGGFFVGFLKSCLTITSVATCGAHGHSVILWGTQHTAIQCADFSFNRASFL